MATDSTGTGQDRSMWLRTDAFVASVCEDEKVGAFVDRLVSLAVDGLKSMYRKDLRAFAFTRRRTSDGAMELEGESARYGAIALPGIALLQEDTQRSILDGESADEFCTRLVDGLGTNENLGDVALGVWAAAELGNEGLELAVRRLDELDDGGPCETVHAAWVVSARTAVDSMLQGEAAARAAVDRLLGARMPSATLFPHLTDPEQTSLVRRHVACFADQVYPIQALARYSRRFGDVEALHVAQSCADRICEVMGPAGQWWWHYDARTGDVIEGYPVYSVHQDSMAPMALLDLAAAGGDSHKAAIRSGLQWLGAPPEINGSLIDSDVQIIWRKVGRREPKKLVRGIRAVSTAARPGLRLRALDTVFPPVSVDEESRPYHLGWILRTWLGSRI
jgi:hypothetical protein